MFRKNWNKRRGGFFVLFSSIAIVILVIVGMSRKSGTKKGVHDKYKRLGGAGSRFGAFRDTLCPPLDWSACAQVSDEFTTFFFKAVLPSLSLGRFTANTKLGRNTAGYHGKLWSNLPLT